MAPPIKTAGKVNIPSKPDRYFYGLKIKRYLMKRIIPRRLHRYVPRVIKTHWLPGALGPIYVLDTMLVRSGQSGLDHYLSVGKSALDNIKAALDESGVKLTDIETCLDLPCGHGRVLRWIRHEIPKATITACEIDHDATNFCSESFAAKGVYSSDDLNKLDFPDQYNLIWVGSLFTHLDPGRSLALIRKLTGALCVGGVIVLSTHGESCFVNPGLSGYGRHFKIIEQRMKEEFLRDGYCYAPYTKTGYYGIAIHSELYIRQLMSEKLNVSMRFTYFRARGWSEHHDIWAFIRVE